ncbi:hypothetical protein C8R43DRAFT_940383 [Mycena crocata]|nr:hypothetical protein C8R43DRAFT_940383 [Mycena crocata]
MPIQPNEHNFGTLDPPGAREGFGELVPPSRQCLPAASSEHEISRSQGTQGPIPGYQTRGPSCNSSVALAVTEPSEEQVGASPSTDSGTSDARMGDVENMQQHADISQHYGNANGDSIEARTNSNSWEIENLAIRRRHKPPKKPQIQISQANYRSKPFGTTGNAGDAP